MYKIAKRVIILISNFGVQYLFSLLTYGFDIICGDIQAGVKIKDVRKILRITILQFQNDNGFTSVILQFFDSLRDFPRRTLVYLPYYITFPLTLIATQSKHSLSAKRFLLSEIMPELDKHPEVRIPFTFQWIFREIGISLSTLPATLFDPIDPESDTEELDLLDQENSDIDMDIDFDAQKDSEEKSKQTPNVSNNQNTDETQETSEEKEIPKISADKIKNKKKITFLTEKPNSNEPSQNENQKTEPNTEELPHQPDQKPQKSKSKIKEETVKAKKTPNKTERYDYSQFSTPSTTSSNIKMVSLHSVFEEYNRDNINVLESTFLSLFFGSFSPTISLSSFIVTISSESFTFLDKFDGNFELFREFVKNKTFDEIIWDFDIPELSTIKNDRGLNFIFNFLSYFSESKRLDMTSLLSEKWVNKESQFNLVSYVPQITGIDLFFSDSKLSSNNYWSSESFVLCISKAPDIKCAFSVFDRSSSENKAGIALLSLFRIKNKILDRFDLICDSLIAPFFEMLKSLNLSNSDDLMKIKVDSSSLNSDYNVRNLLDDLWAEDAETMANICLQFSSQSFPLIFIATPKKYQHYLYESKYVKFSTECAIYASLNKMIHFKDFLNKRIEVFEDITQNMTYNLELISDEVLNDFFEFSLIHFGEISRQCRNMIFSFYNQVKKLRKNCREFDFSYKIKYATDFLKLEASRRFESFMNSEITVKTLADVIEKQKTTNQNLFEYMVAVLIAEFKFIESHTEQENQKIISILIELIKREIIDNNQTNNIFSLITTMLSDTSKKYDFSIKFIEKSIQFLGDHTFFASQLLLNDNFKKNSPSLYSKIDSTVKTFTFQNFSDFVPEIELHPCIKKFSNVAFPPQKKIKSLQPSFLNLSLIPKSIEKYIEFSDWIATVLVKKYLESPTILSTLIDVVFSSTGQFDTVFVQCCIYRVFSIMNEKDFDKGNSNGYFLRRNISLLGQLIGILTLSNNKPKNLRFLKIHNLLSYALSNGKLYGVVGFISSLLMQSSPLFFPPNPFTSSILSFLASVSIIQNLKSHIKNQIETLFSFFNVSIDDFALSESDDLFPDKTKNNFDFNSDLFNLSLLFSENQIERIISFDQNFYFCFISHCLNLPKLKVLLPTQQQQQQQTPTKTIQSININNNSTKRKRRNSSSSSYNSSISLFSDSSSYLIKEFNSQDRIRIIWDIFSLIKQCSKKLSKIIVSTVNSIVLKDLKRSNDKSSILITAKQITKKISASLVSQISFFDYNFIFSNYLTNISLYPDSNPIPNMKPTFQQKILNELKKKVIEENSFWIHQFLSEVTNALSLSHIKEQIKIEKVGLVKNNEIINLMKYVIPNQYLQLNIPGCYQSINDENQNEDKNLFIFDAKKDQNDVNDDFLLLDHLDQNLFDFLCQIDQACTLEVMKGHRSFKELDEKSNIYSLLTEIPEIESKKASLQTFFVFFDANSFLLLLEVLVFLLRQIFSTEMNSKYKRKSNLSSSFDNDSFLSETNDDSEIDEKLISSPNRNNQTQKKVKNEVDNHEIDEKLISSPNRNNNQTQKKVKNEVDNHEIDEKLISSPNRNNQTQKKVKNEVDNHEIDENDNESLQSFACLLMKKFILPPLAIQELISLKILTTSLVDSLFASILDRNDCGYIYERQIEMIVSYLSFYIVEFPHFKPQDFIQSFTICAFLPLLREIHNQNNNNIRYQNNSNFNSINSKQFNKNNFISYSNYSSYANNVCLMKKVIKIRKVYYEFSTSQVNQFSRKIDLFDNIEYTSLFTKWKNAIRAANEFQVVSITKSCAKMPQDFFFNVFEKESFDDIAKFLRCIDKVCEIKSIQKSMYTALIAIVSNKKKDLYNKIFMIIKNLQKYHSLNNSSLPFLLHQLRPLKYGEFTFLWISLISDPHFIVANLQNEASLTTSSPQNTTATTTTNTNNSNSTPTSNDTSSSANDKDSTTDTKNISSFKAPLNDGIYSIGYAPLFVDFAVTVGFLGGSHDPDVFQIVYKSFLRLSLVLAHDFPDFVASIAMTCVNLLPPGFTQLRNILLSVAPRSVLPSSPLTPDVKIDHMSDVHQAAFNVMPLSLPPETQVNLEKIINDLGGINQLQSFSSNPLFNGHQSFWTTQSTVNGVGTNVNSNSTVNPAVFSSMILSMMPSIEHDFNGILNDIEEHPNLLPVIVEEVFNITVADDAVAGGVIQRTPFLNSGAFRFFSAFVSTVDDEFVIRIVDCVVDQLRFRCRNTHFFSKLLIELFKMKIMTSNGSSVSEIIAIAILQRCALQPPHPWGLSITVIELMSNKEIGFWDFPFSKSAFSQIQGSHATSVSPPQASASNPNSSTIANSNSSSDKVAMFLKSIYYLFCNSNNNV